MKRAIWAFLALLPIIAGCAAPFDSATGKQRYLVAKANCIERYPNNLVAQSDCRARAADFYIRPFYKHGDLMTRAQEQRRALAAKADQHEISRAAYEHQVAQSEAAVSREEDRRNRMANRSPGDTFSHLLDSVAGLFR